MFVSSSFFSCLVSSLSSSLFVRCRPKNRGVGICTMLKQGFVHVKARTSPYPGSSVQRAVVPDDKVAWTTPFEEYQPVEYTAPSVLAQPFWADLDFSKGLPEGVSPPKFNSVDGKVDRRSFEGEYTVTQGGLIPLNPLGRTGLKGRGLLGRWGPNHAADPIVSRFSFFR
jgi:ADP-ribose pyrophosphatase